MTFAEFEKLVKSHYPEAEIERYETKRFDRRFEVYYIERAVGVTFHPHGELFCYDYDGSYCDILNEMGIPTVYRSEVEQLERWAEEYEREPLRVSWLGAVVDRTAKARELRRQIEDYKQNYSIID